MVCERRSLNSINRCELAAVLQPSRSLILGSERGWRADGVDMLLLSLKLKLSSRRSMIFVV
ncbi:unnamed protein product [Brassica oleracea]|uniref:(rape) hypothetical protein n=1 Tax=Brassica napus TaxID=3708 RepID=A0A816KDJ5_BRANA|nr:unnamed protein product [Brassica napus]